MMLMGSHFMSNYPCGATCSNGLVLTRNGTVLSNSTDAAGRNQNGWIDGFLSGPALNGAALQYSVQTFEPKTGTDPATNAPYYGMDQNLIQGAAALAGPAQDLNTPFRVVGLASDWMLDYNDDMSGAANGPDGKPLYRGSIDGSAAAPARVVDDATGLREFVGSAYGYTPLNGDATTAAILEASRATIKVGSAVNRDVGSAAIGGATVSWGRWEGGAIDIYSGDGATKLGTIDNSNRSLHWLASSVLNGKYFAMPLTGTATYAVVGNTNPTDLKGNVGTLGSATLRADFANARVDAGVNVSFNSASNTSNWSMSAKNVPLSGEGDFKSSSLINGMSGVTHTVSCSGPSCGARSGGAIDGHIIGGGQGAVMMYNMTTKDAAGAVLNGATGLVVMKK
jgi:hypothetical protein